MPTYFEQMFLFTGLILFFTYLFVKYVETRKYVAMINKIPGPPGNFIFGNALQFVGPPRDLFLGVAKHIPSFGKYISKIWIMNKAYVSLNKAESAEVILSSSKHIEKGIDYALIHEWLGMGLLTSGGSKWHSRRKLLTPTFHFKILEDFIEVFNSQGEKLLSILEKLKNKSDIDVFPYITKCTMDIILESAMGVSFHVQDNPDSEYVKAVHTMSYIVQTRSFRPWLSIGIINWLLGYRKLELDAIKVLHSFSRKIIKERRENFKENQLQDEDRPLGMKKRLAFLDLLIERAEEDQSLTNEDIREEVDTFVFEGHDTTASAITFSLFLLGCHPEIQTKVQEELDSIFMESDRPATGDDLRKMKYLECCIKESLRLYPSVPFISRKLLEPAVIDGYTIPAGANILINIYSINHDANHFTDCEKFIPERFFPENSDKRHPFAFVPFSAGPRNCIGQKFALMEEKVILSSILRRFNVESLDNMDTLNILGQLITRPEKGLFLKLKLRTS